MNQNPNEIETSPDLTEEEAFHLARIRKALEGLWLGSVTESVIHAAQAELIDSWSDHND